MSEWDQSKYIPRMVWAGLTFRWDKAETAREDAEKRRQVEASMSFAVQQPILAERQELRKQQREEDKHRRTEERQQKREEQQATNRAARQEKKQATAEARRRSLLKFRQERKAQRERKEAKSREKEKYRLNLFKIKEVESHVAQCGNCQRSGHLCQHGRSILAVVTK